MNRINLLELKYLNNLSDILNFFDCEEFVEIINYNIFVEKKIKVTSNLIHKDKYITHYEQFLFNLDNYISFIKNHVFIDQIELRYIIYNTLFNKYNKILFDSMYYYENPLKYINEFKKMFSYKYEVNYNLLRNYINLEKFTFEELISFLNNNKKRANVFFENISKDNLHLYSEIINYLQ